MTDKPGLKLPSPQLPPGQQLVAPGKWPTIGQQSPKESNSEWQLSISGCVGRELTFSLSELLSLPQAEHTVDIHCVTRWSKLDVCFGGVLLKDIMMEAKLADDANYFSFVSRTDNRHSSSMPIRTAFELGAFIALSYNDQPLASAHGGPIRSIIPKRYFYKSVKWVEEIRVLSTDRLGNWESESGYHNAADPWLEQRYMAPTLDKRTAAKLIAERNFSGHDLRSIDCSKMNLNQLQASNALLRDAKFVDASLVGVNFEDASLANSNFRNADLCQANFRGADVEGADFSGANLSGADFTGASFVGASFFSPLTAADGRPEPVDGDDALQGMLAATIDASTTMPSDVIAKLFPAQHKFITRELGI